MSLTASKKVGLLLAESSIYLLNSGVVSMLVLGSVALGITRGPFVGLGAFFLGSVTYVGIYSAVEMLAKKAKVIKK